MHYTQELIPGLISESEDFSTPPSSPPISRRNSTQSEDHGICSNNSDHYPQLGIGQTLLLSWYYSYINCFLGDIPKLHLLHILNNLRDHKVIRVIERVAADWEVLACTLGFDESRVKLINREFWHQPEEACIEMFSRWLDGEHDLWLPTWHSLIQCLEERDKFEELAYELKKVIMLQRGN